MSYCEWDCDDYKIDLSHLSDKPIVKKKRIKFIFLYKN